MSDTLAALESRVTGVADGVKEKLDVSQLVKEHPWPALATAIVAGVALSATRADEKAAGATVEAAKRGSSAAVDGLRHVGEAAAIGFTAETMMRPTMVLGSTRATAPSISRRSPARIPSCAQYKPRCVSWRTR